MSNNNLPYAEARSGDGAIMEIQRILAKFGCESFGQFVDAEKGVTAVQFKWRGRQITMEASWRGYAAAWLKRNPYTTRRRGTRLDHENRALQQAKIAVCSVLRDSVKSRVTEVECGIMSFDAAFLAHMMLPSGESVVDYMAKKDLLELPQAKA